MATIKHEPTQTKQIRYPGGEWKESMWASRCTCGDYLSPPSDTAQQAEEQVRLHGYSKEQLAHSRQQLEQESGSAMIDSQLSTDKKTYTIFTEVKERGEDDRFLSVDFSYDELWEHVHDCLDALEMMGKKK